MRITGNLKVTKPALAMLFLIALALLARCTAAHHPLSAPNSATSYASIP